MDPLKSTLTIGVRLDVHLPLWTALKMRLAGKEAMHQLINTITKEIEKSGVVSNEH